MWSCVSRIRCMAQGQLDLRLNPDVTPCARPEENVELATSEREPEERVELANHVSTVYYGNDTNFGNEGPSAEMIIKDYYRNVTFTDWEQNKDCRQCERRG